MLNPVPNVAIVGRPNVGKSTLLNRFLGRRAAIVEEMPGVTRDRAEHLVDWSGREFRIIDTGGWQARPDDPMGAAIREQAERAIELADVVLMVCDAQVGVTSEDDDAADLLRRAGVPVVLCVNKVDHANTETDAADFYRLGLGEPYPVSAFHGRRSGDVLDAIVEALPEADSAGPRSDDDIMADIAIVGRPNVGKSTLFNRLTGDERSIVHDAPGTTRDAIDTVVELDGQRYRFVDTAGLRRRAKVDNRTEYYSRVRAIHALERCDIALLVVDATEGVTFADQKVAEEVVAAGRGAVVLLNKWDLLAGEDRIEAAEQADDELAFIDWAPRLRISARSGANVGKLSALIGEALDGYRRRIPTHRLVQVVEAAQQRHPPPVSGGVTRIRYATQVRAEPPTFALFANRRLPSDYLRYIEHSIRDEFGFAGTPLRLKVRIRKSKRGPANKR